MEEDKDNYQILNLLKTGIQENEISIYKEYINRLNKENELYWNRFKIYLSFNTGVLIIIGYLLQPYIENGNYIVPENLKWVCIILSAVGLLLALNWLLICLDGSKWQKVMKNILKKYEEKLFNDTSNGLYTTILNEVSRIDIIKTNIITIILFMATWIIVAILIFKNFR